MLLIFLLLLLPLVNLNTTFVIYGAIQVLRNAYGGWRGVSNFPGKSVTKVEGSELLELRGGG